MGLISTMTRRVRNNRLSRRLSTTSTKLHDEDANDLIKTLSGTSRVPSMDSTSTIVYQNPVVPSESPANRGLIKTKDMHVGSLFDQEMASRSADRAARALAGQEYPVLRLDMCQSAEPRRALQEPLEMGGMGKRRSRGWKEDYGNGGSGCSSGIEKGFLATEESVKEKKKRSVGGLLKRHCSLSLKKRRGRTLVKGLGSAGGEGEGLVDVKSEKLEAHLKRRNSLWSGFGKSW